MAGPGERPMKEVKYPPNTLGSRGGLDHAAGQSDVAEGEAGQLPGASGPLVGGNFRESNHVGNHNTEF